MNDLPKNENTKAGDAWIVQPSETKSERLEREIVQIEAGIQAAQRAEEQAKNDQHWLKKRLKLAKEELSELKESSVK